MRIFVKPMDVMLFRDGKPFSAAEDVIASSMFPPLPGTFYGAIRAKILSQQGFKFLPLSKIDNKSQYLKQIESITSNLSIVGPFIADENHFEYFPIPRDVVKIKGSEGKYVHVRPTSSLPFKSDLTTELKPIWVRTSHDEHMEDENGLIRESELRIYLRGEEKKWSIIQSKTIYQKEERVGIKRPSSTRTSEEGFFYIAEFIRLNDQFGFTLDIEGGFDLPDTGFLKLGGEARAASYTKITERNWNDEKIKEKIEQNKLFKLYLTTPAIFKNGWFADWMQEGTKNGLRFRLVSACVGKPLRAGGFDIVENKPKPMKKAVPAGSIYFFELLEGDVDELFKVFQFKSISDEKQKEGYGITLVGGWSNV